MQMEKKAKNPCCCLHFLFVSVSVKVTEFPGLNCVYEVNYTTGCLLNTFGSTGTAPGCMVDPSGITCDRDGNIYVADSRNHRIQVG